jgi:O-methyltransferase involved in polyketide biosynthesis
VVELVRRPSRTAVDFERQSLRQSLDSAGFAFQRPAVFSWTGATMYLTLDAIAATLATIGRALPGTQIVLTYNRPRQALDAFGLGVTSAFQAMAIEMGEPFVSLFVPDTIEELLLSHGYTSRSPEPSVWWSAPSRRPANSRDNDGPLRGRRFVVSGNADCAWPGYAAPYFGAA